MLKIIPLLLIISSSISFSNKSILKVNFLNCNEIEYDFFDGRTLLSLYKEDSLIQTQFTNSAYNLYFKSLSKGNYQLTYTSKNEIVTKINFTVDSVKVYEISICIDSLKTDCKNNKTIIQQIKSGETFKLNVSSSGCFHSSDESMIFKKLGNKYTVTYNEKTKLLDLEKIEAVAKFELKLYNTEFLGFCTTSDYYIISYKNTSIKVLDSSCSWRGFDLLKEELDFD